MHEALALPQAQVVDDLLVLPGSQRAGGQHLGLPADEEPGPVHARQQAHLGRQRTDLGGGAAVRADAVVEDHPADLCLDERLDRVGHPARAVGKPAGQGVLGLRRHLSQRGLAGLLVAAAQGLRDLRRRGVAHRRLHLGGVRGGHRALRAPHLADEVVDPSDDPLDLGVRQIEGLQQALLGHFPRPRLDHGDGIPGAGDHQVQVRRFLIDGPLRRIDRELAVDQTDPHRGDRPVERNIGDPERRAGAGDRQDIRRVVLVGAEHRGDDLHVVAESLREQRTDRPVHQARGENRPFPRPALALEEAAGDLPGGKHLLFVVARQREKVDPFPGRRRHRRGHQHHRVPAADHHGAVGLPGEAAGLDRDRAAGQVDLHSARPHRAAAVVCPHLGRPPLRAFTRCPALGRHQNESGAGTPLRRSPPQSQPLHNRVIALRSVRAEVGQQPAPLPDHPQQPPSRMEVVFVRLEMLAEVIDPFGQTRDLDVGRPAVFGMPLKLAHRYLLRRFTLCAHLLHLHAPDPPALRPAGRSAAGAAGAPARPPPSLTGAGAAAWLQESMITHSPRGWQTAGPGEGP